MHRSGTEAIRTQIQPSKPKREITNITNSQNTKRKYGQASNQLFPKRWPLSNRNQTKNNMNTHKVRHQNSDTKNRQQSSTTKLPPWNIVMNNWGGGGGLNMFYGANLALSFLSGKKHLVGHSVRMITL